MPKLSKVQKKVAKKRKDISSLNEKSRDAIKLRRAGTRAEKLERQSAAGGKARNPYVQRTAFFQGVAKTAKTAKTALNIENLQDAVHGYVTREAKELGQLQSERRPGRPPSTREDVLKQRIATEDSEYNTGYWLPDLRDEDNMHQLRLWNGEWASMGNIRYVRLSKEGQIKQSSFPPKGQS